jgi:hypothetical protein
MFLVTKRRRLLFIFSKAALSGAKGSAFYRYILNLSLSNFDEIQYTNLNYQKAQKQNAKRKKTLIKCSAERVARFSQLLEMDKIQIHSFTLSVSNNRDRPACCNSPSI